MLRENWLLQKLRTTAEPCIGTWVTIPSLEVVDIVCSAGPDFIVIDMEHAPTGFERAQHIAMVCESRKVSPVLRVPEVDVAVVRGLETGMHGLQLPNIGSALVAAKFVEAAKYGPMGNKGFSPYTRVCNYTALNSPHLIQKANGNTLLVAQVEGEAGIQCIDEILKIKGIDICFLGMFDLSNYLGIPGQLENPRLRNLFAELSRKILDAGVIVGSISNTRDQLRFLLDSGVRYITHSADCQMLSNAYRSIF